MLNRTFFPFAIVPFSLVFCATMPVKAGWFGPSNYHECVLDKIQGKPMGYNQVITIEEHCKALFPDPEPVSAPVENTVLLDPNFIKTSSVQVISNGHYGIKIEDKPSAYHINSVEIRVSAQECSKYGDDTTNWLRLFGTKIEGKDIFEFNITTDQFKCYDRYFYGTVN